MLPSAGKFDSLASSAVAGAEFSTDDKHWYVLIQEPASDEKDFETVDEIATRTAALGKAQHTWFHSDKRPDGWAFVFDEKGTVGNIDHRVSYRRTIGGKAWDLLQRHELGRRHGVRRVRVREPEGALILAMVNS